MLTLTQTDTAAHRSVQSLQVLAHHQKPAHPTTQPLPLPPTWTKAYDNCQQHPTTTEHSLTWGRPEVSRTRCDLTPPFPPPESDHLSHSPQGDRFMVRSVQWRNLSIYLFYLLILFNLFFGEGASGLQKYRWFQWRHLCLLSYTIA